MITRIQAQPARARTTFGMKFTQEFVEKADDNISEVLIAKQEKDGRPDRCLSIIPGGKEPIVSLDIENKGSIPILPARLNDHPKLVLQFFKWRNFLEFSAKEAFDLVEYIFDMNDLWKHLPKK